MIKLHNPASVHQPATPYSHGAEVAPNARWLYVSGQVGVRRDGSVAPDVPAQVEQAWENLLSVLASAGMTVRDLVKITAFIVGAEHLPAVRAVRERVLAGHRPATTFVLVAGLAQPDWKVEIEAVAAR